MRLILEPEARICRLHWGIGAVVKVRRNAVPGHQIRPIGVLGPLNK